MTTKQIQAFVLWLRRERIAFSTLSIGGITLDGVTDLKLAESQPTAKIEPRPSAWERYAGDLLNKKATDGSDIPEESMED